MRLPRAALAVLLLAGLAAPAAHALRPITVPAPEFPDAAAWINSKPFTMAHLKNRRVVMIAFINLYSINSLRTVPWLRKLWDDYALKGLMIIGVHSPDYEFDKDPVEIRAAAERQGIRFPIIVDSKRKVWNAYRNGGWPSYFLVDHRGLLIHDREGEGGYAEFEHEIVLALERHGARFPKDFVIEEDQPLKECGKATAPFYIGTERGKDLKKISVRKVEAIVESRDGEVGVVGKWAKEEMAVRFKGERRRLHTRMEIIYQGAESLSVLTRTGRRPGRLYIKQDNLWLHAGNANTDIEWDDDDRSYVLVDHPRLYFLTRNRKRRMFKLTLIPAEEGIGISAFEFSDHCQTDYEHK